MPRTKSILAFLLALSFFFSSAQAVRMSQAARLAQGRNGRRIIGYATVSRREARDINQHYALVVSSSLISDQLGHGFYIANQPDVLQGETGSWYCVIKANRGLMMNVGKAWIPESYFDSNMIEEQDVWDQGEDAVVEYIATLMERPTEALRFSWVKDELAGHWNDFIDWEEWNIDGDRSRPTSTP
ncbi:uncharacterized protein L3040_003321 [Drepanopeziza brunnea f. sp. 'multigermtubi']|uniref:uncharacterized protein n=1 Tax=Drepanopeziza brunnea f. sp. 'multigermtubi' TaxID=698441 RepID=UPI00238B158D|nr:hypothetical protein L3040_003321 [Drepanopeziza brunnea f. sp. 'multigermtubi']